MIHGVERDAEYVVQEIAARFASSEAPDLARSLASGEPRVA